MIMVHATCIAVEGAGVLLRGPSGSGKSDLALRAIDQGARLVADDQVVLTQRGAALVASAPPTLRGLIEIRGLGIMRVECDSECELALVIDLTDKGDIERLPEPARCSLLGIELPLLALSAFEASASAKLRFAVRATLVPGRIVR